MADVTLEQVIENRARRLERIPNYSLYNNGQAGVWSVMSPDGAIAFTGSQTDCECWIWERRARATIEADLALGLSLVPAVATEAMCKAAYRESPDYAGDVASFHEEINAAIAAGDLLRSEDDDG